MLSKWIYVCIAFSFLLCSLSGCSNKKNDDADKNQENNVLIEESEDKNTAQSEDNTEGNGYDIGNYAAIVNFMRENIPELKTYAEFVEQESEGNATFIIDPNFTTEELYVDGEFWGNYYYVYTGEVWEDHRANWDWFLVSEDLDEILWWDIVEIKYLTLDEWRQSSSYRILE